MLNSCGKLSKSFVIFILVSFVFMSVFGMGMGMDTKDGQMSGCPFVAGEAVICQMSGMEHIVRWQQSLLGIPTKINFLALVVILLAAVIILFANSFSQFVQPTKFAARIFAYHKVHVVKIFDQLLAAFSDGILNPKVYSFIFR